MLLLVSGASATQRRYPGHPRLGWLRTPRNRNSIAGITESGVPWACDNDCYQRLDRAAYLAMLRQVAAADRSRLLWVTAPDVVADARSTLARFRLWRPVLAYYKLPIAFVAQDGQGDLAVPWDQLQCLFVGGSTAWKLGPCAEQLIYEAHDRGKWVHIGRVNTLRRMWWFSSLPVDSIDGSCFSKWPDKFIPWMLGRLGGVQHRMEDLLCS
jgi:hypothetical protein